MIVDSAGSSRESTTAGGGSAGDGIADATAAVVFFGVPHFGSALAVQGANSENRIVNYVAGPLVKGLGIGNVKLQTLDDAFRTLGKPPATAVISLGESKPTKLMGKLETTVRGRRDYPRHRALPHPHAR